jgi:O-antigen ligase
MEDLQFTTEKANPKVSILVVIMFFVIFVPSSFHQIINSISLYLFIPVLFVYSVIKYPKLIIIYKPLTYLLLLFCWSLITSIKSTDLDLTIREIRQLLGVFMLCYIFVFYCFTNPKYIYIFYLLYILKFFTIFYFALNNGLQVADVRFDIEELNANMFGYFGFFSIVSAFFLWQSGQYKLLNSMFLFVLFALCLFLSVISCFIAASRAGIAISVLAAVSLLIIYIFNTSSKKAIWGIVMLIILGAILVPVLSSYYEGSVLESRFQIEDLQNESRYHLIMRAVEVGCQNPLFGVGPGNYELYSGNMQFSHSTYTELFANNGVIALLLFISILYSFLKKNMSLYSSGQHLRKNAMYFFCFILLYILYNLFYGFHLSLFLMGFFFVVLAHLEISLEQEEGEYLNI